MLYGPMTHPGLLAALGRSEYSGKILITDGNYPVASGTPAAAERILLNLAPGLLDVTRILEVLKCTVPTERAGPMMPAANVVGIEVLEVIPTHDEYRVALPGVAFDEIPRWDFYDAAKAGDVTVVIVLANQQFYANLLLTIGVRAPGEQRQPGRVSLSALIGPSPASRWGFPSWSWLSRFASVSESTCLFRNWSS